MEGTGGDFGVVFPWVEDGLTGDFPDCLASAFVVFAAPFCLDLEVFFKDWKLSLSESTSRKERPPITRL